MPITGIGGLFFRAKDPKALQKWYRDHLGVAPNGYEPWQQQAGPTMLMPFKETTDYFPAAKQWMLNLRVSELDELVSKLKLTNIAVQTDPSWNTPETGRFARIHDPEGNAVELWEPPVE